MTIHAIAADALSCLYENSPIATAICDASGQLIDVNAAMCSLLGYEREGLLRKTVAGLTHPDDLAHAMAQRQQLFASEVSAVETEQRYLHSDGHCVWARASIWAVVDSGGKPQYAIGQLVSIDKTKQMEQQLALARQQRDTLVREVHHRIKNNLQSVTGLLHRQLHIHPDIGDALAAAIGQVETIAIMHGLQSSAHKGHLQLCDMLAEIVTAANQLHPSTHAIALENQMPGPVLIASEETVALALMLNELVTNAVKHCSSDDAEVGIRIVLQRPEPGRAVVKISNPSPPLPASFDFAQGTGTGMGLRLVRALLPHSGTLIRFDRRNTETIVTVTIEPPILYTKNPDSNSIHARLREPL